MTIPSTAIAKNALSYLQLDWVKAYSNNPGRSVRILSPVQIASDVVGPDTWEEQQNHLKL